MASFLESEVVVLDPVSSALVDRISFYAALEESRMTGRKIFLLHQIIAIGHLPHGLSEKQNLTRHYETLNQKLQRRCRGDSITGLLLLYPACFLHIIECSSEGLVSVLEDLNSLQEDAGSDLRIEPRLLLVSHDLPRRLYCLWTCMTLNPPATSLPNISAPYSTHQLVSHILDLALRLGSYLLKTTKGPGTKPSLETIVEEVPDLFVPQDIVILLLKREDLLSPLQYLQAYHSPHNVQLDSDPVWHSLEYPSNQLKNHHKFHMNK
ncbi:testis-expressed protein 47 isoform X2 [Brachyhypopomus gauderio]|uniref:testis-expressed protein 47 isoform X2 n=1 Tax=Brachyhypopomus gauderio TaxID=698409 RepID=UPI004043076C